MILVKKVLGLLLITVCGTLAYPEQGKWAFVADENLTYVGVSKSVYAGTKLQLKVQCHRGEGSSTDSIGITWVLRKSPCWHEYLGLNNQEGSGGPLSHYFHSPQGVPDVFNYTNVKYNKSTEYVGPCNGENLIPPDIDSPSVTTESPDKGGQLLKTEHPQFTIPNDGIYLLVVYIKPYKSNSSASSSTAFQATVNIEMKNSDGYLSAVDWPLLPFYGTLCGLYAVLGLVWLLFSFYHWRDILRIQMWIGGVLFLGMFEKAVYLAEYESLNNTGELTKAAELAAEVLSCAKRSLARILVLIVSMGFGIVKPRLGATLQRIVVVGSLYMALAVIEAYLKLVQPKNEPSREVYASALLLALLDAGISWWIFSSLVQTTRTLRLRRNMAKLSLYRHFTNTLIIAVLSSLVFMMWSIYYHQMAVCLTDWKELWLDEAFWKLLFLLLLFVIMLLWRPTNNNQRYAFTPLLDSGDEDEPEQVANENFGLTLRGHRPSGSSHSPRSREGAENSLEDELKWVEENIPSSVTDAALPLLDSDEELMNTRFELSKMQ